jgi:hypothetical protein
MEAPITLPPGCSLACAMCGRGLSRWYLGHRGPVCADCNHKHGPVRHPSQWGPAENFSGAGLAVRNSYLNT